LASVRPTTGFNLGQILGADAPDDLKDMQLPTFGLVVSSHDVELESNKLTDDGFSYFRGLFGCPNGVKKAGDPNQCTFTGKIDAGVNMLANVQFPGELAELGKALWIDTTKGVQFRGTVSIPGWSPESLQDVGLGLEMILPEVNPQDAVE